MKYSVLFLILILLVSPCFSATQSFSKDDKAALSVTWDLSAIKDYYKASIGFGSSQNPQYLVSMKNDPFNSNEELTASAEVVVWWDITAPTTVLLKFLPGYHLSVEGSSNSIPWNVSWKDSEIVTNTGSVEMITSPDSAKSGTTDEITFLKHNGLENATSSGTLSIDLKTEDASSVIPAEYSSSLTAVVRVQ